MSVSSFTIYFVAAAVTEVVDPENTTQITPFATVDPNNGSFSYESGVTNETLFPTSLGRMFYGYTFFLMFVDIDIILVEHESP